MVIRSTSLFVPVSLCSPTELKEICELTSIDQLVLERAFSFRTVEAKQEKVSTTLNVAQVGFLNGHTFVKCYFADKLPHGPHIVLGIGNAKEN